MWKEAFGKTTQSEKLVPVIHLDSFGNRFGCFERRADYLLACGLLWIRGRNPQVCSGTTWSYPLLIFYLLFHSPLTKPFLRSGETGEKYDPRRAD